MAESVNALGNVDAVIHNAGIYTDTERNLTVDGHPRVVAVNVLAPYLLTALINRPARLIYLSSGMHTSGRSCPRRPRLATRRMGRRPGLLRQQAARHHPRRRRRPALARRAQQRRRPRLGPDTHGRPTRHRRPRPRPRHPGLARHQRRTRRRHHRSVLAPPTGPHARTSRERHRLPRPTPRHARTTSPASQSDDLLRRGTDESSDLHGQPGQGVRPDHRSQSHRRRLCSDGRTPLDQGRASKSANNRASRDEVLTARPKRCQGVFGLLGYRHLRCRAEFPGRRRGRRCGVGARHQFHRHG